MMNELNVRARLWKRGLVLAVVGLAIMQVQEADCYAQLFVVGRAGQAEREPTELAISPAAPVEPFLAIELLPPLRDRRPGNAIVWYGRVKAEQNQFFGNQELQLKIDEWTRKSLDELRQEEFPILSPESSIYYYLKQGSYSLETDWQLPIYDGNYFYILLPDIQEARSYARILAATARWQIAHGQLDEAIETLRIGYALARKCGESPTFISALVGMAISNQMHEQLVMLMQQPEAPNLYWALSALPQPLVDPRLGLEGEFDGMELTIGSAVNAEGRDDDAAWWTEQLERLEQIQDSLSTQPSNQGESFDNQLSRMAQRVGESVVAKQVLIDEGWDREVVEKMPLARRIIMANWIVYQKRRDRVMRWLFLNHAERIAFRESYLSGLEELPDLQLLNKETVVQADSIHLILLRQDRRIALLRTVEALRAHAAVNDGKFPERLDQIMIVPVPNNPMIQKPFEYQLQEGVATISDASYPADPIEFVIRAR